MQGPGGPRLLAIGLAVLLGACGGPATSSTPGAPSTSTPSASPTAAVPSTVPSLEPSPTASPSPTIGPSPVAATGAYPELGYVNRFVMRVAMSDLSVRQKPSRSATSNGKAPEGGLFMMLDWPIVADGYTWYYGFTLLTTKPGVLPDLPTAIDTGYDEVLAGWMATGTEDTPFLIPLPPRCPVVPDLLNVAGMLDSEIASCLGSDPITLEGTFGCTECGGATAGIFEPQWLAGPLDGEPLTADGVQLVLHFAPGGPTPPATGSRIRVRGHFSDERSPTCRITPVRDDGELDKPIANAAAEQWCRGKFVVDNLEVIG